MSDRTFSIFLGVVAIAGGVLPLQFFGFGLFNGLDKDPGISYATFKLADGRTCVRVGLSESAEKQDILSDSPAFERFQENIRERCDVPPDPRPLTPVGSYNFSGAG